MNERQRSGRRLYGTSRLRDLNEGRRNASRYRPLRGRDPDGEKMAAKKNVATLQELIEDTAKVQELCGNGDSHILVADELNPGYYSAKPLYDIDEKPMRGGEYVCDIHEGRITLYADTLVLWR